MDIDCHSINLAKKASCISKGPKSPVTCPWQHDAALQLDASSPPLEASSRKGPVFFPKSKDHSNFYQGLISISDVINGAKPVRAEEIPTVHGKNLPQGCNGGDFACNACNVGSYPVYSNQLMLVCLTPLFPALFFCTRKGAVILQQWFRNTP